MSRSLRRTLAVRFAATMAVGLVAAAAVAYVHSTLAIHWALISLLFAVVVVGTAATLWGAWWLAGAAVRPVFEITEQATRVEAGTLSQPIVAHADTDEYRGLVAVLNRMLERLDVAFRNQRRLTADIGHELRSPLTALQGEIEVALRAERTPREYQRVLHSALEEIERLSEMSEDLLLITRAEAGVLQVHPAPTDLNEVVEHALEGLRSRLEERELTVARGLAGGAAIASVDRALVERAVRELLDNAVKFVPAGGAIRVATGLSDGAGSVALSVEDSGPGIPGDDLPHLFEPFYRADQARSRGTGTGLGLAMVAAIVRLHRGVIRASNVADGGGARFDLELPAASSRT